MTAATSTGTWHTASHQLKRETRPARAPPPGTLPLRYKRLQGRCIICLVCQHGLHELCTPGPPPVTVSVPKIALTPLPVHSVGAVELQIESTRAA